MRHGRGTGRDRLVGVSGRLVLGGAPLGQPGDVGPRLREVMASADVLAVELDRHDDLEDLVVAGMARALRFLTGHAALHDMMVTKDYHDALPQSVRDHLVCRVVDKLVPVTQKHDIEGLVMGVE